MVLTNSKISFEQFAKCFLPVALIILINPFIGMVTSLLLLYNTNDDWEENFPQTLTFLIATAVWISLVNITKTISSDQIAYSMLFKQVPERGLYSIVFKSWDGSGKDPLYSFITWLLYYTSGGNLKLFFFTLSMAIYMFHFMAAYKLFRSIGSTKGTLICGVIVLTFFTQYFVMTLHIIRQMLAAAVVIYAIVYRATEGKYNWWFLVAASLIHTSAILLVVLSLIPWIYSWMNLKKLVIVLVGFILFLLYYTIIGSTLENSSDIEIIKYAGQKLGDQNLKDGITISMDILMIVFVPLGLSALLTINRIRKEILLNNDYKGDTIKDFPLLSISYLAILLIIFVLSFSKSPLIQYRFFYYSYSFIPLLLPLLFKDRLIKQVYQVCISLFFVIRFFMIHNDSTFKYAPASNFIIQPITYYFTGGWDTLLLN